MKSSSYLSLPERFFSRVRPTCVSAPRLIKFNSSLAAQLGLGREAADAASLADRYSGNALDTDAEPIAMVYAGHQFGQFVPQLGDGRAILLGEVLDGAGSRRDVQLKGAGRTPYSRGGDGRAAVGPVLREYLVSEAMHALGIPTTRALAAVFTGETVYRETALPGAILTRVAASHVRVGSFEFFAAREDVEGLRLLADYVIERHYPLAKTSAHPYQTLLKSVIDAQASLVARWMLVGFIHGVMNTDNMTVSGETIDFGPCAFLDVYDPAAVFSSIDRQGRYAYANQPNAAAWNLARFAESLLPLIDSDVNRAAAVAGEIVGTFPGEFAARWLEGLRRKLGLASAEPGDAELAQALLEIMHRHQADFTMTFRALCDAARSEGVDASVRSIFANPNDYDDWARRWHERLRRDPATTASRVAGMQRANPAFIPRNHRIEQMIGAAVAGADLSVFNALSTVLAQPYLDQPEFAAFALPPQQGERVLRTFCGT
jgi:uncharacterized protein YdiU (UPF0061 family)